MLVVRYFLSTEIHQKQHTISQNIPYRPVGAFSKSSRPYRSRVSVCPPMIDFARPRWDMVGAVLHSPGLSDCGCGTDSHV